MTIKIYTLTNPIDGNIFYVGKTDNLNSRLAQHISNAKSDRSKKGIVISYILYNGKNPIMEEIDSVDCEYREDEDYANTLEVYWMNQMKSWGFKLSNQYLHPSHRVFSEQLKESTFEFLCNKKQSKIKWFSDTISQIKNADNLTFDQKNELVLGFEEEKTKWFKRWNEEIEKIPVRD